MSDAEHVGYPDGHVASHAAPQVPVRHAVSVRLVHWISAALVLSLLGLGLAMVDSFALWRQTALIVHKTGGVAVLLLTLLRLLLQLRQVPMPVPPAVPKGQHLAAVATHRVLYVLLLAVPLSGWAMQGAAGTPVSLFGVVLLPSLVNESLAAYGVLRVAHGLLTTALLLVVLAHIAGALHDGLVGRHGLLQRMLR
jgi:cytochrome b561